RQARVGERVRLIALEHAERAARLHAERADAAHHLEDAVKLRPTRDIAPRRAHAEACGPLLACGSRRVQRLGDAYELGARDARLVVRRLRTVRAVFRAPAALDVQENRALDLVRCVVLAMRQLCLEDNMDERS